MVGFEKRQSRHVSLRFSLFCLCFALLVASCTGSNGSDSGGSTSTSPSAPTTTATAPEAPPTNSPTTAAPDPVIVDPDSHTVSALRSVADYEQLAKEGIAGQSVLKFSITEFSSDPEIEPGSAGAHSGGFVGGLR